MKCFNNSSNETFIISISRLLPGGYLEEKGQLITIICNVIHPFEVVFLKHTLGQFSLENLLYIEIMAAKSALEHMSGKLQKNLEKLQKRVRCPPRCATSGIRKSKKKKNPPVDKLLDKKGQGNINSLLQILTGDISISTASSTLLMARKILCKYKTVSLEALTSALNNICNTNRNGLQKDHTSSRDTN